MCLNFDKGSKPAKLTENCNTFVSNFLCGFSNNTLIYPYRCVTACSQNLSLFPNLKTKHKMSLNFYTSSEPAKLTENFKRSNTL